MQIDVHHAGQREHCDKYKSDRREFVLYLVSADKRIECADANCCEHGERTTRKAR
jgi:hypothetical protein